MRVVGAEFLWLLALVFLASTVACSWNETQHVQEAVFSDDDSMHLYVVSVIDQRRDLRFENQRQYRNPRHQLMLQNVAGSDRRATTVGVIALRPRVVGCLPVGK